MKKINIRMVSEKDIPKLVEIYRPYVEETSVSFEYTTPTVEEFTQRVKDYTAVYPYLIAECQGEIMGYAYGSRYGKRDAYQWCAELSIYLSPKAKGLGIGKKLYEKAVAILEKQGVYRLYAIISHPNEASVNFHKKMGFVEYGRFPNCGFKLGQWHDLIHMERELKQAQVNPVKITPVLQLPKEFLDEVLYN